MESLIFFFKKSALQESILAPVMNRSPYWVSVKNHSKFSREFPYNQLHLAQAYADKELKGYKAVVSEGESAS